VDDEDFQVDLGKRLLVRLGYRVTTRTDSREALGLFSQKPDDFDLVITDMTMPAMTGDVLAAKIISIRPDIPVIVCTGFSERIDKETIKKIGIKELAMKPLAMKDIAEMIRRVLDEKIEQPGKTFKLG
jgi:CheY-like chemotaxis protein